ncbi:hypothetical protein CKO25_09090 [Thiocapsa imhoffii]|uniref:DUF485 domain-containing protein n=1 Tax=Thiocapsa imhoffii TaxID=382777 RepID=A0A9X0WHW6_9GAMM|nr:DUF485 domain-containing protein [Thiocapsa imhoffii]MBK1644800.1 hypothetical protein [Thiocapsa imhoffii]
MRQDSVDAITAHPRYQELIRARKRFALLLTAIMMLIYYGLILVIAFAPDWLGVPVAPGMTMTVGIPIGILVILSAFILTGIYVARANGQFDRLTKEIQEEFE